MLPSKWVRAAAVFLPQESHTQKCDFRGFKTHFPPPKSRAFPPRPRLDESLSAVYSNRAACHFMLSDHENCVADCDNALRLLETAILAAEKALREGSGERAPMDAAQRSKLRTLARRGSAHCLMQNHRLAAEDYEAALLLDPQNMDLKADLVAVEAALQRERIVGLKAAADGLFRERSFEEAAARPRVLRRLPISYQDYHMLCLSS